MIWGAVLFILEASPPPNMNVWSPYPCNKAGVPNPRAATQHQAMAHLEPGCGSSSQAPACIQLHLHELCSHKWSCMYTCLTSACMEPSPLQPLLPVHIAGKLGTTTIKEKQVLMEGVFSSQFLCVEKYMKIGDNYWDSFPSLKQKTYEAKCLLPMIATIISISQQLLIGLQNSNMSHISIF